MIFNMREREIADRNFAKGILQGKAEGKAEGIIEMVTNLLGILDDATLASKTGLSLEQVQALRQKCVQ